MDVEAARFIGAGLATMALIGAGIGIGIVFGNFLSGATRARPPAKPRTFCLASHFAKRQACLAS